ncbi:MAG: nicotinate (nicotinamide) nucleotide adenylyltransferase [Planctomycetota bacterium]
MSAPAPLRLAVFGGSFDPVHEGHTEIARRAERVFGIERVLWIPASIPPHKADVELAPAPMRLAMLLIATACRSEWEVSTMELEREGPSYTYDTLLEVPDRVRHRLLPKKDGGLAARRRELELYMILGSDNLSGLPLWKNVDDVLSIAQPIVVWRGGETEDPLADLEGRLEDRALERLQRGFLRLPPLPQSSTEIREALARGEVPEGALSRPVLEFIVEKGLYGWPADAELPADAGVTVGDERGGTPGGE